MNEKLDQLIDALRHELQQYGEMVALFERQQDVLIRRDSDEVMNTVSMIQSRSEAIQEARRSRVQCQQKLAETLSVPPDGLLSTLLPALPPSRRPQLQALMDENNRLLRQIHHRAQQNHLLLTHSLEHMTRFINSFLGAGHGMVYNGGGGVASAASVSRSLYEAVG